MFIKILIYIYSFSLQNRKKENGEERSRLCTMMWNHLVVSFPLHWNICILCVNLFQFQKIFYLFIIIKKNMEPLILFQLTYHYKQVKSYNKKEIIILFEECWGSFLRIQEERRKPNNKGSKGLANRWQNH